MADNIPIRRAALGARLRDLRARRFRSGTAFARAVGWPQSRVSKLERGAQLPSQDDLDTWVAAAKADPSVMVELQEMLGDARLSYRTWRDAWSASGQIAATQTKIGELDARAQRICEYQPAMVPGLLQTPAYAREVLTAAAGPTLVGAKDEQIDQRIAGQIRRQQLLYTPGKRIQIVVGEAALLTRFATSDALAGQLDRLIAVAGLKTVTLGVLRFETPSPVLPLAGFALNDASVVWVETLTGEQMLDDPVEVAAYAEAFNAAVAAAATDAAAVDVIRRAQQRL
jgi:transcriptional regulator with XRE-family HTH domain